MKLYNTKQGIVICANSKLYLSFRKDWDAYINRDDLYEYMAEEVASPIVVFIKDFSELDVLAPISQQEVWAAGVTYMKSREARMEESKNAGGGDFYARVYDADRPEIFFKSTAARTVGTNAEVFIRRDSKWNVPEPELTLFATASGKIVAYTCGNDMSSRDIEGENPLYLPQAKSYDGATALGPCLYVPEKPIDPETGIQINIYRDKTSVFLGNILINRMKRQHDELIGYLFREMTFPKGVFLMTGTGLVPPNDFTLAIGDVVEITIDGIGTLKNVVAQRPFS